MKKNEYNVTLVIFIMVVIVVVIIMNSIYRKTVKKLKYNTYYVLSIPNLGEGNFKLSISCDTNFDYLLDNLVPNNPFFNSYWFGLLDPKNYQNIKIAEFEKPNPNDMDKVLFKFVKRKDDVYKDEFVRYGDKFLIVHKCSNGTLIVDNDEVLKILKAPKQSFIADDTVNYWKICYFDPLVKEASKDCNTNLEKVVNVDSFFYLNFYTNSTFIRSYLFDVNSRDNSAFSIWIQSFIPDVYAPPLIKNFYILVYFIIFLIIVNTSLSFASLIKPW
jgi:hypothetical protein